MAVKEFGGLRNAVHNAVDSARTKVQDIKIPEVKVPEQMKKRLERKESAEESRSAGESGVLSTASALQIIYYLIAADEEILQSEEEEFELIGKELDPDFCNHRETIIEACRNQMDKVIDPEDYLDVLQEGIGAAIRESCATENSFITPNLLLWDLLTIAYSDGGYDEKERKLLKYVARNLNVDKAVFLELENSIQTMFAIEHELAWVKTTDRPYLTIESVVNELVNRKNVIFESVQDLIRL